jgi:hypothetical protein
MKRYEAEVIRMEGDPEMGIGVSVFLIASGAILTFALEVQVGFLDLGVVGWILMAVGVLGLIMTTMLWRRRPRTVTQSGPTRVVWVDKDDTLRDPPY